MAQPRNFKIGLFETGDCGSCLLSCVCCPIAAALSRSKLDNSEFCFNFFCLPSMTYRFFVKSAYGIGDPVNDACTDVLISCCCFPCNVNQLYQTTASYGVPAPNIGRDFNTGPGIDSSSSSNGCLHCLYGWFCMPCAIGTINHDAFGLPFLLGCLCMNTMNTRNFLRYQYRLGLLSSKCECCEECFLPWFIYGCGSALASFLPCFWTCICSAVYGGLVGVVTQEQAVVQRFGVNQNKSYLVGYNPAMQGMGAPVVIQMVAPGQPMMAPGQPMMMQQPMMAPGQPMMMQQQPMMMAPGQPMMMQQQQPMMMAPGQGYVPVQAVPIK